MESLSSVVVPEVPPGGRPACGPAAKRRFAIESLEERIAPASSLLDLNVTMNVVLTGPIKNVHLNVQDVYLIVQDNVIQASVGGTLVGVVQ